MYQHATVAIISLFALHESYPMHGYKYRDRLCPAEHHLHPWSTSEQSTQENNTQPVITGQQIIAHKVIKQLNII